MYENGRLIGHVTTRIHILCIHFFESDVIKKRMNRLGDIIMAKAAGFFVAMKLWFAKEYARVTKSVVTNVRKTNFFLLYTS